MASPFTKDEEDTLAAKQAEAQRHVDALTAQLAEVQAMLAVHQATLDNIASVHTKIKTDRIK